jgi:hypothetical protein
MYNWKIYNKKKNKLAIKFDKFNAKNIFNFIENSYYNHTRDLFSLIILSSNYNKAKILDYGSNVASLSNLKNKIDTKKHKFFIYDPFKLEEKIKVNLRNINYQIYNNINLLTKKVDLVHFGSSLQYLADYNKVFDEIKFKKKSKILITATPFTLGKEYSSVQKNHKNLRQKVNNYEKLVINFKKRKFNLVFKSSMDLKMASVKNAKKKTFFLNMIFERI